MVMVYSHFAYYRMLSNHSSKWSYYFILCILYFVFSTSHFTIFIVVWMKCLLYFNIWYIFIFGINKSAHFVFPLIPQTLAILSQSLMVMVHSCKHCLFLHLQFIYIWLRDVLSLSYSYCLYFLDTLHLLFIW